MSAPRSPVCAAPHTTEIASVAKRHPCEGMRRIAVVVYGLSENWLGGMNYFRNLVSVFDDASASRPALHLHVLTDAPTVFTDLQLSNRVTVHGLEMLRRKSAPWVLRKAVLVAMGRDALMISLLKRMGVQAVVFSHVSGASAAGIHCLPWIPDFQSRHHPELFEPANVAAEHARAQAWVRDCDGLIVSSLSARDDARAFHGLSDDRIHIMRFAPRLDASALGKPAIRDAVFARHGIDRPYVFLPNQYWQHKNHSLVVKALRLIHDSGGVPPMVVSTGKTDDPRVPAHFASFQAELRDSGMAAHYLVLGVIDRLDMLVLLAHAMAVVNPSRFEGWSSSVEEAKALGKRLLVSDIPVHREQICGLRNASLFGLDDSQGLAGLLASCQVGAGRLCDHPPVPVCEHYQAFAASYMNLLQTVTSEQSFVL